MEFVLQSSAAKRLLLVAHRGTWGGNLPCNTLPAYELALSHGADMIEIDVDRTADGKLIIFHPGKERQMLGFHGSVKEHDWSFVRQLRYLNYDQDPTQFGVELLDDVLDRFKGRCYLNVDKFWENPERISTAIRDHGMTEQVVVKSRPRDDILDITEKYCADLPFMGIVRKPEEIEVLRRRKLRYVGSEVLFDSDESVFATREFVDAQHHDGLLVWINAIVYDHHVVLAGGHSDDRAACGDKDGSWGWIADRGYDLMQTDWTLAASIYLAATGRRPLRQANRHDTVVLQ